MYLLLITLWLACEALVGASNVLQISGTSHLFNHSAPLQFSTPFKLFWSVASDGSSVKIGVQAKTSVEAGWVAIGFNPQGDMAPARAVMALMPTGATTTTVTEFMMSGKSAAAVIPANAPVITGAVGEFKDGVMSFVFILPASADANLKLKPGSSDRTGLIYATGPRPTSLTAFGKHDDARAMSVALATTDEDVKPSTEMPDGKSAASGFLTPKMRRAMIAFHGTTMALTWFILIPVACLFASPAIRAKIFSGDIYANPRYTLAHKIGIGLASIVMVIGYATGYFLIGSRSFMDHFWIGTAVLALVIIQCWLGLWRSSIQPRVRQNATDQQGYTKEAQYETRQVWGHSHKNTIAWVHAWTGRLTWVLAIVNCYTGINIAGYESFWTIVASIMIVVALIPLVYGPIAQRRM